MKRLSLFGCLSILALFVAVPGYANLVDNGGGLIYDIDLNITWYNAAPVSRTWADSVTWAANLSVTDVNRNSIAGWRLPSTVDGPEVLGFNGTRTGGYNITTSEMGHLFYTELGNRSLYDVNGTYLGFPDLKKGPFTNLQTGEKYWSGTEYALDANRAWDFQFLTGGQGTDDKVTNNRDYALAVHDGNVATVPAASTMLLLGTGLLGLMGIRRRAKK